MLVAVPAVNGALAVVAVDLPAAAEVGERANKRVMRRVAKANPPLHSNPTSPTHTPTASSLRLHSGVASQRKTLSRGRRTYILTDGLLLLRTATASKQEALLYYPRDTYSERRNAAIAVAGSLPSQRQRQRASSTEAQRHWPDSLNSPSVGIFNP